MNPASLRAIRGPALARRRTPALPATWGSGGAPGCGASGGAPNPAPRRGPFPARGARPAMPAPVLLPPRDAAEVAPPRPIGPAGPVGTVLPGVVDPDIDMPLPTRTRPDRPPGPRAVRDQVLAPPPAMEPEAERGTSRN